MKEFVFLYPISPYIEGIIGKKEERWLHQEMTLTRLNAIVDMRYRQKGFGINWILFSTENDPNEPDYSLKAEEIKFELSDNVLSAGIPFPLHTDKNIYSDPSFILSQVPSWNMLRIGGFHQFDCVDKLAKCAYETKNNVKVDEDTTEIFLMTGTKSCLVPLVRDVKYLLSDNSISLTEYMKKERLQKPWFAQIIN